MLPHNSAIVGIVPSQFDGNPVLVLASGFRGGTNRKLGSEVIQVFYLREDIYPSGAANQGADYSVCGNCSLRPIHSKVCYVGLYSVNNMHLRYTDQGYPPLTQNHLDYMWNYQKVLRLGAYGDPCSVPLEVVQPLIDAAATTLGYTHQWRSQLAIPYRPYLQASVDSPEEAAEAIALGWKYYRIKLEQEPLLAGEILCPWNQKGKQYKQCQDCRLCSGDKANVATIVSKPKTNRFKEKKMAQNLAINLIKTQYNYQGQEGVYQGDKAQQKFLEHAWRTILSWNDLPQEEQPNLAFLDRKFFDKEVSINKIYGDQNRKFGLVDSHNVYPLLDLEVGYLTTLDSIAELVSLKIQFKNSRFHLIYQQGITTCNYYYPNFCQLSNRGAESMIERTHNDEVRIYLISRFLLSN